MRRSTASATTVVALLTLVLATETPRAADWPQWRGPARDGKSPETGLLRTWPEGGPPLAWKMSGLGTGFSSVAVVGERIYTMGDFEDGQYAEALAKDGSAVVWKTRIGSAWRDEYLGPRGTPSVADGRVYVLGTDGSLACLDAKTGSSVWQKHLPEAFRGFVMKAGGETDWKFSESPLVDGNRVIVTPGAKDAALVALDAATGKEIWRTTLPDLGAKGVDGAGYSSPVVSNAGGRRQYVQLLGRGVVGVDAATGRFLWGYNRIANAVANISTPLIDGDRVFASTAYGGGSALVEIRAGDEKLTAREVFFLGPDVLQNHHGGMILHEGHVYTGDGQNKGLPVAVELATGKLAWGPIRNAGKASAAISYADSRLYLRYQNGLVLLVEATPEAYREHGSFEIPGVTKPSWAHPVISGGKLYLREQDVLYCYDVAGKT